jgi:hypothetical protein
LSCKVLRKLVDDGGKFLPCSLDSLYYGLTSEFAFCSDIERYASNFVGEGSELLDHAIDIFLEFDEIRALYFDFDLLRKIASSYRLFRHECRSVLVL